MKNHILGVIGVFVMTILSCQWLSHTFIPARRDLPELLARPHPGVLKRAGVKSAIPMQSAKEMKTNDKISSAQTRWKQQKHTTGRFSVWKKFLQEQAALDKGESVGERVDRNIALGDGLTAQLEQNENVANGASQSSGSMAKVLKSADATIANAGFDTFSRKSKLFGQLNGNQLRKQMEFPGTDSNFISLKRILKNSRHDLRKALHGEILNSQKSVGLGALALDSMTDGLRDGLSVYRKNPITGTASGALAMVDSSFVNSIGKEEERKLASGSLPLQATLVGLGSLPHASRS
jgi:hypothetical protein